MLLSEAVEVEGLSLYHEVGQEAAAHVTKSEKCVCEGAHAREGFVRRMLESRIRHAAAPAAALLPPTSFSVRVELASRPSDEGAHADGCLTMDVTVRLETLSRLNVSLALLEHAQWLLARTSDFQLWQFLHTRRGSPQSARDRWATVHDLQALKRRVHSGRYTLAEAVAMRRECKEYVRLYKKRFNGPEAAAAWRRSLPPLAAGEASQLEGIELAHPAEVVVNFRRMAQAELKTEAALNGAAAAPQAGRGGFLRARPSPTGWQTARELTQLEQLHLHGRQGYGVNIYRGLPPPPASLKIRLDVRSDLGAWWVCRLGEAETSWALALDCVAQPVRAVLTDSLVDASVFATVEVPEAPPGQRPLSLLLGRSAGAFAAGSPGRHSLDFDSGGSGAEEWCSLLELRGAVCLCSQVRTALSSSPSSPWDVFLRLACGERLDLEACSVCVCVCVCMCGMAGIEVQRM